MKEEQWNAYYKDMGHLNVPGTRTVGHTNIAEWIRLQKQEYKKKNHGNLTDEQVPRLKEIGFEES